MRWRHVDTDRAVLWIHLSNAQTKAGIEEKETKTGQRRKVTLDPYTTELLTEHWKLWEQRCAALECTLDPDAFVFSPAPDASTPHANVPPASQRALLHGISGAELDDAHAGPAEGCPSCRTVGLRQVGRDATRASSCKIVGGWLPRRGA